ncbi:uncharacterized protein [Porites lutea]|uniref:uncharacterized protein n=1 Tax=Porites lutea TaxID=51062 RepID=UPI003CC5C7A5
MVDTLKLFIKAERTGNWMLHLKALHEMLPYFAAAGHTLYTKSAYIYCQKMPDLPNTHPQVNRSFLNGLHVVRRSDRFWAGLSTDLIIEQVLMRSVKTTGGLTRGRGMSETQRLVWLMSMPACADINNSMQNLTGTNFLTSEQHKDTTKARQEHDQQDTNTTIRYLSKRSPFDSESSLRNIATGVVADDRKILDSLTGKNAYEYTFRKKNQVVTLACKTVVRLNDGDVQVDPQLMFQRLSIVATTGGFESPQQFFEYEMCSFPASLFDASLLPLKANKPVLADAIWSMTKESQTANDPGGSAYFVTDGGALLHRVVWPRGVTYNAICLLYIQYVRRTYPRATIVFDGYDNGPTTKDCTHQRRGHGCGLAVLFDPDMLVTLKKDEFLSNQVNKQKFINLLSENLEHAGYSTRHAKGDADVMIATGNVCLQAENLPPTSSAASFHSLRVYFQVQEWKQNQLRPQDWGWRLSDGRLLPILTDRPPAHQSLLEMIRCNCRTDCNTQRCSCKKHGLECSSACGVCKGESCLNSSAPDLNLGLEDAEAQ